MPTSNMSLNTPSVGVTAGPDWATQNNENFEILDTHDHTSGKGAQLTPSSLNINADLEFNQNSVTEVKNLTLDNTIHSSASGDTNVSVYVFEGNLYYRNNSGVGVQITNASSLNSTGGAITSPSTNSQVLFSSVNNSYTFKYDKTQTDGIAKIVNSDIQLYFYNNGSATTRSVNLKYTGSGTGSNTLTVPDETGTLLSTATNFAGTINIATSSSNAPINLKPNGTGSVAVGNGGATGKLTSNGAFDLVLDTNSGTNSGTITITDGVDGDITIDTNGTGDINLTAGADVNIPADIGLTFGDDGEKIEGDGTDLTIASSGEININSGTLDLSAQTVDVTLNGAVDALNFDSNTLSIDASNNRIGIGTAAPGALLSVNGSEDNGILEILRLANSDWASGETGQGVKLSFQTGNNAGTLSFLSQIISGKDSSYNDSSTRSGNIQFVVNNANTLTEAMRIASNGRIGIGTASPSQKLELSDSATVAMQIRNLTNSGYSQIHFGTGSSGSSFCTIRHERVGADQGKIHITKPTDGSGGNAFTIDHTGNATIQDGNLVIGTAGKGIDFSNASGSGSGSASALLDDYEEGTWTPKIIGRSGGELSGSAYDSRDGDYTKIGRKVFIQGMIILTSKTASTSPSGDLAIGNLPFTIADTLSGTVFEGGGCFGEFSSLATSVSSLYLQPRSDSPQGLVISFIPSTAATGLSSLSLTNISTTFSIRFSATYITN